jgi:hypothetical protein
MILLTGQEQQIVNKPRATSAYGTHNTRRNLNHHLQGATQMNGSNMTIISLGGTQKGLTGMKNKMQVRTVNGVPQAV